MKQIAAWILLFTWAMPAQAQVPKFSATEKTAVYLLGNKRIELKLIYYGNNSRTVLLNLHHNENTAVEAAKRVLSESGGMLICIENNNERFIEFSQNGKTFRFDPNRIFTEAGIKQSLQKQSDQINPSAVKAVRRFAKFIRAKIPSSATTLVAIHNNDEGNLSVASYMRGGEYAREASSVHHAQEHDPDNFFFTTDLSLFRKLSRAGFNVILQHNKKASDDGSLSVYYGRRKKSYVNVEAESGKLGDQQRMLNAVISMINDRSTRPGAR